MSERVADWKATIHKTLIRWWKSDRTC